MEWLDQHFDNTDHFPRPDWEAIGGYADKHCCDLDQHDLWCTIAKSWFYKIKNTLPNSYSVEETDNFMLLAPDDRRYNRLLLNFLERTRKRILSVLPGITCDDGDGKHAVLVFDDIDLYYTYIAHFYPDEGTFGLSGGTFINEGYGHFALPWQELSIAEAVAAHEMTHALVSHLPIPAWLDEGLAVNMESLIAGTPLSPMDMETHQKHLAFWNENTLQEFWSGDAFQRPDEGQELSYHLAQFATDSLCRDYESFTAFANQAHFSDAGDAAAQAVYQETIGLLAERLFGEGEWSPNPKSWKSSRQLTGQRSQNRVGQTNH